jgi:hypothetical protein
MEVTGDGKREGGLRILLAVLAGGLVFPAWLAGPYGAGPFRLHLGISGFLASAHPTTLEFVRWAGAGVMAGLVTACLAPRWRWIVVPPLLYLLEFGWWVFIFFVVGVGDVPIPSGTYPGMAAGVILGLLAIVPCRAVVRPSRRVTLIAVAAAAFILVLIGSAGRGRSDVIAMRQNVLPAVERLLRADVLVKTSPVEWIEIRRKLSFKGQLCTYAYGEMRGQGAQIALEWPSQHPAPEAGSVEGFRGDGLQIQLEHRPALDVSKEPKPEDMRRVLKSSGVRPELLTRLAISKWPGKAYRYATQSDYGLASYHGLRYTFDWHTTVFYPFARMHAPLSSTLITCRGTYSASSR